MPKRKSFFERLTGAVNTEDEGFAGDLDIDTAHPQVKKASAEENDWMEPAEEAEETAQLTVDMYQTPDEIIIKTIVAGLSPDDLEVSITREIVTISGRREEKDTIVEDDYFHQELYWGAFSRTVMLPEEVDIDGAEATEYHGILTIRLPKIDKKKETKLKVKAK